MMKEEEKNEGKEKVSSSSSLSPSLPSVSGSLDADTLAANKKVSSTKKSNEPGIVYLSRIPHTLSHHTVRGYLEPFGKINRIYLAPDDRTVREGLLASKNYRDKGKARFTEGWIEYVRKKDAKSVALALNGRNIKSKKSSSFHDDIWNIKYLKGFQWSNLHEEEIYKKAVRQQKLRSEISQARKVNSHYMRQAEEAREIKKIEETRLAKKIKAGQVVEDKTSALSVEKQLEALKSKFRQRKVITKDNN